MKELIVLCMVMVSCAGALFADDNTPSCNECSVLAVTCDVSVVDVMQGPLERAAYEFDAAAGEVGGDTSTADVLFVPRGSLFDIALPANGLEFNALAGNAVLLITAFTHDRNELPLKRIYMRNASGDTDLRVVHMRTMPMPSEQACRVLGTYRMDYFVCLPYDEACKDGMVLVDWNTGRTNYSIVQLPINIQLPFKPLAKDMLLLPDQEVLTEFMEREFGVLIK